MQLERRPQQTPQEIQIINLVPEQAVAGMQSAIINKLQTLPTPITITEHADPKRQQTFYTYQVGTRTEEKPYGIAIGATPDFLDALRFSLEAVMQQPDQNSSSKSNEQV